MDLWTPENVPILIDNYSDFPKAPIVSLDIETNGREIDDVDFRFVCIGFCDGIRCWCYFDISDKLIDYLHKSRWIVQDGIHAELPWLNKLYGGFTPEHIYADTKIGSYVHDSTRKNYSLKPTVKEYLGVEYPTYTDITHNASYIAAACQRNPNLRVRTKKETKDPKNLTLDQLERGIVANYNAADTYYTWKLHEFLVKSQTTMERQFLTNIEMPMNRLIYRMETRGIKIDTSEIRRIHNATSKERRKIKKELLSLAGAPFNPNSPKQVLELLKMHGINSKSSGVDDLARYRESSAFVRQLLEYRGLQKICSTYTIPLYFNAVREKSNRIHAKFGQNTITGRLSSSDPVNLQNQPPIVRSAFIADSGNSFVDADWSNIEIYIPAHLSGEPRWIDVLRRPDGDLHMATAARLFGESVYSLPEAERKAKRKIAKETLLTITNSGTYRSLARTLECDESTAQEFERATKDLYPTFVHWLTTTKRKAREQKGISSYFGRWVSFPQLTLWCGRPNCDEICAKNREFCKPCFMRQETEKQAISVKVQGTASDLCKMAALRLYREYGYVPNALVHDEILLETPDNKIEETQQRVKYVMEHLYDFVVPLKAEIKIAKNWLEAH